MAAAEKIATYRWQLTPDAGFRAAADAVVDLAAIGFSHLYLSPVAEAVPGSTHGYDAVDPTRLRAELGGGEGFAALVAACRAGGMGILIDIVPNHLAAHAANPWWWDLLRFGRASRWAAAFDVDWDSPKRALAETILLPILGDHYGRELEAGRITLERGDGPGRDVVARYYDHVLPLAPESVEALGAGGDLDAAMAAVNGDPDRLDDLLEAQHYRLARWQVGDAELDYRRFFDVDSLVATRADRAEVFDRLHELPLRLVADGAVDGLRVDHVDGLRDPQAYLDRLRAATGEGAWLLVEKILRPGEDLPPAWPVAGTTGYEVADLLGGWLTDPAGAPVLTAAWHRVTGEDRSFEALALDARRSILATSLAADVERIVSALVRVCEGRRRHRDHARPALRQAVVAVATHAPAYRSYVRFEDDDPLRPVATEADRAFVGTAVDGARSEGSHDPELLELLEAVLSGGLPGEAEADVALRFQQLTGPVAAKGEEDTALYRWLPLPHRCEVGADAGRPSLPVEAWHDACRQAQARWPERLTSLTTHDTKRSADVRARLAVLTTVPVDTLDAFATWWAAGAAHRADLVDRGTGWLVFHTLVGAHPLPVERAWPVLQKSVREARVRTSWTEPDLDFEDELETFVGGVVDDPRCARTVAGLVDHVAAAGDAAALAQLAAQLLAPGVPDVYQGGEGWDRSLVDPDNRRPVDAAARRRLVERLDGADAGRAWADPDVRATGLPRLLVLQRALGLRRRHGDAFGAGPSGAYQPLSVTGPDAGRVLAFARGEPAAAAVVAVRPGPGASLAAEATVTLPPGGWTDAVTGDPREGGGHGVADLIARFPVAVLGRR